MISKLPGGILGGFLILANGCSLEHHAPLRSAELPALAPSVLHSNRLWIDVADRMPDNDCVAPGNARLLCFERLRSTVGTALTRSLWSSFPGVELLGSKTAPAGDYVLHVDLGLEALPPDANAPGWSAGARGNWRLDRNGQTIAGEQVASRSRTEFAYGTPLGIGASEVIDAIAVRIGVTLGGIPETRIVEPMPLPEVATAPLPARTQVIPHAPSTAPAPAAAAQAKTMAF
ncbi:MAG TPA: hypothetical protein VIK01_07275 [Polyangiaceae bacterium]